jgi:hypothetical protein
MFAPNANPAASTAGAIQTFNWAKDVFERKPPDTPPAQ